MSVRKLVKSVIPKGLFPAIEPYGHLVEAVFFNTINGFPARKLKVIGVTGTNGKTSTTYMIHRMLHEAGYKVGLMTTVAYGVGDDIKPQMHHMTNVTVPELMRRLKEMNKEGMEWLVMESGSQGLAQNRLWGMPYTVVAMTNVTHEHLDYHRTFERYRDAKRKLFKMCNHNKRGLRVGVINAEDPSAEYFASDIAHPVTYGIGVGDLQAHDIKLTAKGSTYTAKSSTDEYHITCHIPGGFYVSNTLAVVGVGAALGLSQKQIEHGIAALKGVEGRMTTVDEGQQFSVIVDYAHTPDSFEKLFKDIRPVVEGKLIVLFGSAGRRDEAKRAIQGKLAGEYADEVIITEEDDRDIDGTEILNQIAEGVEAAGKERDKNLFLVHDRTEAIAFAVGRAKAKGDTVLLLGKGHEKTIERNGPEAAEHRHLPQDDHDIRRVVTDPWDEISAAHAAVKALVTGK